MPIPDRPLEFTFDPNEMTLDELCLFEPDGFSAVSFRQFLRDHTNWTKAEIGALKVAELKDVAEQIAAKLKESAVPLGQ